MFPRSRLLTLISLLFLMGDVALTFAETYYRGGRYLDVQDRDVRMKNGKVQPGYGVSLSTNKYKMQRFGGAYRLISYPTTLEIKHRGNDPEHYELMPVREMTREDYQSELNKVQLEREDL